MIEDRPLIYKYLRHDKKFPHVWCPGCGTGILLGSLIRGIDRIGLTKDEVVLVSGIGCSGRLPVYVDFNTLHTTHGRALTFATGVKLAKPELTVIVIMGDGDATAIGGNHFIHAARRNIELTAIIVNNSIYGMTGGQYSPTTPYGQRATTAIYGTVEHSFNIAELAVCAGGVFVARGTVYHVRQLDQLVEQAIRKKGFSVVEVITQCHTHFGRLNQMGNPVEMLKWQRDNAVPIEKARKMSPEEMAGKFTTGILVDREAASYLEEYEKVRRKAKEALARQEESRLDQEEKEESDRREASHRA
jgi:2-oxoglutarate ferredoxin oxidoreductase subunit beta